MHTLTHTQMHTHMHTHSDYHRRQMREAYIRAHVVAINFKLRHISTDKNYMRASKLNNANAKKQTKPTHTCINANTRPHASTNVSICTCVYVWAYTFAWTSDNNRRTVATNAHMYIYVHIISAVRKICVCVRVCKGKKRMIKQKVCWLGKYDKVCISWQFALSHCLVGRLYGVLISRQNISKTPPSIA